MSVQVPRVRREKDRKKVTLPRPIGEIPVFYYSRSRLDPKAKPHLSFPLPRTAGQESEGWTGSREWISWDGRSLSLGLNLSLSQVLGGAGFARGRITGSETRGRRLWLVCRGGRNAFRSGMDRVMIRRVVVRCLLG